MPFQLVVRLLLNIHVSHCSAMRIYHLACHKESDFHLPQSQNCLLGNYQPIPITSSITNKIGSYKYLGWILGLNLVSPPQFKNGIKLNEL